MRFNDGAIDPAGRFWGGSMTDNSLHTVINEGALFTLSIPDPQVLLTAPTIAAESPDLLAKVLSPVEIPNGIGWTPDKKTMLFTDSPSRTIFAFDYDLEKGSISNRRPWFELVSGGTIRLPKSFISSPTTASTDETAELEDFTFTEDMVPDGFQIDANGDLWTAIWGGGMVIRIKDLGDRRVVTGLVKVPAICSTCPRFVKGGAMLITSAAVGEIDSGEHAGKVFWAHVGVEGGPTWKFGCGL
jgi:sugar lactone lactonase YvrE